MVHRILEVELDGQELEQVKEFVYLGSTETAESEREVKNLIAEATTALSRLKIIWRSINLKMLKTKQILLCSVVSLIFLYASESWTINK